MEVIFGIDSRGLYGISRTSVRTSVDVRTMRTMAEIGNPRMGVFVNLGSIFNGHFQIYVIILRTSSCFSNFCLKLNTIFVVLLNFIVMYLLYARNTYNVRIFTVYQTHRTPIAD